jgi:release factor glutamine methyltransferase
MSVSVHKLLYRTERFLKAQGIDDARISSEEIIRHFLGYPKRTDLFTKNDCLGPKTVRMITRALRRRAERYPLQYIVGSAGFHECELLVREDVLIPRPETELLVETVIRHVCNRDHAVVLDIGTGTGNVPICIARACPQVTALGIDISAPAIACAKENATLCGVADRVHFRVSDLFTNIAANERFDCIVSNPPYIRTGDIDALQPEVLFEPRTALDGGIDGIRFYEKICDQAPAFLHADVLLAFEIGHDQAADVIGLMEKNRFYNTNVFTDLAGYDRVVIGFLA